MFMKEFKGSSITNYLFSADVSAEIVQNIPSRRVPELKILGRMHFKGFFMLTRNDHAAVSRNMSVENDRSSKEQPSR